MKALQKLLLRDLKTRSVKILNFFQAISKIIVANLFKESNKNVFYKVVNNINCLTMDGKSYNNVAVATT